MLSKFLLPSLPGPVIGLVLLVAYLKLRRSPAESLVQAAEPLTQHLGLLFIPAAVGVVMFWPRLQSHMAAVVIALLASVVLCIGVTALVLKLLSRDDR